MTKQPSPLSRAFLSDLAIEAGALMREGFDPAGVPRHFKDEGSANETPVTKYDLAINALVLKRIREELRDPALSNDVSIEGEEASDLRSGARFRVVCDPIDGTFPYAHGIPCSTFVLAVLDDHKPVSCVIYDPQGDQLFLAERGQGATCNGRAIQVCPDKTLSARTTIGSVWWSTSKYNLGMVCAMLPSLENAPVLNLLSISYMGAKVACGQLGATLFPGENAHDNAATHLLVEEAGGVVTDIWGDAIDYRAPVKGHIAANAALHGKLVSLVAGFNPRR